MAATYTISHDKGTTFNFLLLYKDHRRAGD